MDEKIVPDKHTGINEKAIRLDILSLIIEPSFDRWKRKGDNAINFIDSCLLSLKLMDNLEDVDAGLPFKIAEFSEAIQTVIKHEVNTYENNRIIGVILETFVIFDCPLNQIINAYSEWKGGIGFGSTKLKNSRLLAINESKQDTIVWLFVEYDTIKNFLKKSEELTFPKNKGKHPRAFQAYKEIQNFFNDKDIERIICREINAYKVGDMLNSYLEIYDIIKNRYPVLLKKGHFKFV